MEALETAPAHDGRDAPGRFRDWLAFASRASAYQHFVPDAWRRSKADTRVGSATHPEARAEGLSEREAAMFGALVRTLSRRLERALPVAALDTWFDEVLQDCDGWPQGLPLFPVSIEFAYDDDIENAPTPLLVLAALAGTVDTQTATGVLTDARNVALKLPVLPGGMRISFRRLSRLCKARGGAWLLLPEVFALLGQQTGNPFLDSFTEDTYFFDGWLADCGWTLTGLNACLSMATDAGRRLLALARFERFLGDGTTPASRKRYQTLFEIWRACWVRPRPQRRPH